MITESSFSDYLLQIEPEFKEKLDKFHHSWTAKGNLLTPGLELSEFTDFVVEKLKSGNYPNAKKVFDGIKYLLQEQNSNETVRNAVVMSFLESLQNISGWDRIPFSSFVPLLGPKSIEHCRALDKFWGTKTPGLPDEDA